MADRVIAWRGWPLACVCFAATNAAMAVVALLAFDRGSNHQTAKGAVAAARATSVVARRCALCTGTFVLVAVACNIGQLSYAAVAGSLVPYYAELGFDAQTAALLAGPLTAAPNLFAKLGFGRLSDTWLGPCRAFVLGNFAPAETAACSNNVARVLSVPVPLLRCVSMIVPLCLFLFLPVCVILIEVWRLSSLQTLQC